MSLVPGVIKGLAVTLGEARKTVFPDGFLKPPAPSKGAVTVQYPRVKEDPTPRARGVIALHEENCTACRLCARECPDWCMYCGICVEVCPFEALFWSPEYEFSEPRIADLLHDKSRLADWMTTVPDFEAYEAGSEAKVKKVPR